MGALFEVSNLQESVVKVRVPKPLKYHFKSLCAKKGLKMKLVLEALIRKWVRTNGSVSGFIKPLVAKSDITEEDVKAYIHSDLKTQFKILCVRRNVPQRFVLYNLIIHWINEAS